MIDMTQKEENSICWKKRGAEWNLTMNKFDSLECVMHVYLWTRWMSEKKEQSEFVNCSMMLVYADNDEDETNI